MSLKASIFAAILPSRSLSILTAPQSAAADPSPAAIAGFNSYIAQFESRLARQHSSDTGFLAPFDAARVRGGEVELEQITPASGAKLSRRIAPPLARHRICSRRQGG